MESNTFCIAAAVYRNCSTISNDDHLSAAFAYTPRLHTPYTRQTGWDLSEGRDWYVNGINVCNDKDQEASLVIILLCNARTDLVNVFLHKNRYSISCIIQ